VTADSTPSPDGPVPDAPIIALLGPTASGKTAVSIELARRLPRGGECVLADSMQVYRGMPIGTAQPTSAERARAPHHLCGFVDPRDADFTVRDWLDEANRAIESIRERGSHPIVVGGTNLYIRSLLEGVFDGPGRDDRIRDNLERQDDETLHRRLQEVDPPSADRIHRNDRRRMIRALEVHAITGTPLSDHKQQWTDAPRSRPDVRLVVLDRPVDELNQRINARVKAMLEAGFLEEVDRLRIDGGLGPQAREAVGYRELLDHLEGRCSIEEATERIKIRTRRYGKQQRTWLRRFAAIPGTIRLDPATASASEVAETLVGTLDLATEPS
jgi:tRNA dimethylallyltransferase